jgi:hypothetical protein
LEPTHLSFGLDGGVAVPQHPHAQLQRLVHDVRAVLSDAPTALKILVVVEAVGNDGDNDASCTWWWLGSKCRKWGDSSQYLYRLSPLATLGAHLLH